MGISRIKVNYKLRKGVGMGYSSAVSLGFILLDLGVNVLGVGTGTTSGYKSFIRWLALGSTMGAIFEHGYKELSENGAFDPEVMSIMYLFNSIHNGTATRLNSSHDNISYAVFCLKKKIINHPSNQVSS